MQAGLGWMLVAVGIALAALGLVYNARRRGVQEQAVPKELSVEELAALKELKQFSNLENLPALAVFTEELFLRYQLDSDECLNEWLQQRFVELYGPDEAEKRFEAYLEEMYKHAREQ